MYNTQAAQADFSFLPVPADFFGPGSDPFTSSVPMQSDPVGPGNTDTIVRRLGDLNLPSVPSSSTVPIELVALSLVSAAPVTVTFNGGQNPENWDLAVDLDPGAPPQVPGLLTAAKSQPTGGTFSAGALNPVLRFSFTNIANPGFPLTFSIPALQTGLIVPADWVESLPPGHVSTGPNFYPNSPTQVILGSNLLTLDIAPALGPIGVPSLGEWGLAVLAFFLLVAGYQVLTRRRRGIEPARAL